MLMNVFPHGTGERSRRYLVRLDYLGRDTPPPKHYTVIPPYLAHLSTAIKRRRKSTSLKHVKQKIAAYVLFGWTYADCPGHSLILK